MSYETRDTYGMYKRFSGKPGPGPDLMGANTLIGDTVLGSAGENLGDIKEIMLDMHTGKIAYAVLSFGGFLGFGEKLFAVPFSALRLDTAEKAFVLSASKEQLQNAPGFDKNDWPDMSDPTWIKSIDSYYAPRH
ncbi:MAG: PRC-barrel domain-containing protein [Spongiibacteraceae bacterium]